MPNMQGDAGDAVDVVLHAAINKRAKTLGSKAIANGTLLPSPPFS
jgi:hypothetical protein